jgi:asparagine synthase (glutamine-hydrolysing)
MSVDRLYSLKGEIARRGIRTHFGVDMPVFAKRRFQHGAIPVEHLRRRLGALESDYRRQYLAIYQ